MSPLIDAIRLLKRVAENRGGEPQFVRLGVGAYDAACAEVAELDDGVSYRGTQVRFHHGIAKLQFLAGLEVLKDLRAPALSISVTRDRLKL